MYFYCPLHIVSIVSCSKLKGLWIRVGSALGRVKLPVLQRFSISLAGLLQARLLGYVLHPSLHPKWADGCFILFIGLRDHPTMQLAGNLANCILERFIVVARFTCALHGVTQDIIQCPCDFTCDITSVPSVPCLNHLLTSQSDLLIIFLLYLMLLLSLLYSVSLCDL